MTTITAYAFCPFCAAPMQLTRQPSGLWTQALVDGTDHPRAACEQATKSQEQEGTSMKGDLIYTCWQCHYETATPAERCPKCGAILTQAREI